MVSKVWIGGAIALASSVAAGQVTFTIDHRGPTNGFPDVYGGPAPITEGDILAPAKGQVLLGPLFQPGIAFTAGPGGLTILTYPGPIEVDALSYGNDGPADPGIPPEVLQWRYSTDEFALGFPSVPMPPTVETEGIFIGQEASGDAFIPWLTLPGPLPPFGGPPDHTATIDGNGFRSFSGFGYPGLGLLEWNPPFSLLGDNLDGLDVDGPLGAQGFWFSLDASFIDPLTGLSNLGTAMNNGFSGADVLFTPGGVPPVVYAPAPLLGLDLFGFDVDDVDALVVFENGIDGYQPSFDVYEWLGGQTDMLLFSVRRGSAIIGFPDFFFGIPIEEGDILMPPPPNLPGMPPGIFYAAENLGLRTLRSFGPGPFGPFGDELDGLDITMFPVLDCNSNGFEDAWDIAFFGWPDLNLNGVPDFCDIAFGTSADVSPANGVPDEVECGTVGTYCVPKTNSLGCNPIIWSKGTPCMTCSAPFTIDAVNIISKKNGLLFYGYGPANLPWLGGTLCVQPPLRRTSILNSQGVFPPNNCSGAYTFDMNAWIQSLTDPFLTVGSTAFAQFWYRDPAHPDGTGIGITDAATFTVCP